MINQEETKITIGPRQQFLLTQHQLAEHFEVSRSMVNLVDRAERSYTGKAARSYAILQEIWREFALNPTSTPVIKYNKLISKKTNQHKSSNEYEIAVKSRKLEKLVEKLAVLQEDHKSAGIALALIDKALSLRKVREDRGLELFLESHQLRVINKFMQTDRVTQFKLQLQITLLEAEIKFRQEI